MVPSGGRIESADNERVDTKKETAIIETRKEAIRSKSKNVTAIMPRYEFTQENYNKLFGENNRVNTPIEEVLISKNQFDKLKDRGREGYMGAMNETLKNPDFVINEEGNGDKHLYVKSFKRTKSEGIKTILVVVVKKGNVRYAISTHQKELNNLLNKAKKSRT
ncbi:MAG: hypothetical protein Ta2G_17090 [Termitinemataceae bacterium]|nr:MAG: hypothetical protein Ta2G_17090 [Termitinemataceae bacterium]